MHPDEEAFLEAIRAGDDTARLVFADWLEERGDRRAPWVRDPDIWAFLAPDATDPVPKLLEPTNGEIPFENRLVIARLGTGAVPALIDALAHTSEEVRRAAADVLGQIGSGAVESVPALIGTLRDEHKSVRRATARALQRIGPRGRFSVRRHPATHVAGSSGPCPAEPDRAHALDSARNLFRTRYTYRRHERSAPLTTYSGVRE